MKKIKKAKQFKKKKFKAASLGLYRGGFKIVKIKIPVIKTEKIRTKTLIYTKKFRYKTPHFYIRKIKIPKTKKFKLIKVKKTFYIRPFKYARPKYGFRIKKIKSFRFKKIYRAYKKTKPKLKKQIVVFNQPKILQRKRKRFQTFNNLYEVFSRIRFDNGAVKVFRVLYGDEWGSMAAIKRIALEKIMYMLSQSGGKLLELNISKHFR